MTFFIKQRSDAEFIEKHSFILSLSLLLETIYLFLFPSIVLYRRSPNACCWSKCQVINFEISPSIAVGKLIWSCSVIWRLWQLFIATARNSILPLVCGLFAFHPIPRTTSRVTSAINLSIETLSGNILFHLFLPRVKNTSLQCTIFVLWSRCSSSTYPPILWAFWL